MENLRLAEFHQFKYNDDYFLYNINAFEYFRINEALAKDVEALQQQKDIDRETVDKELLAALEEMQLVNPRQKKLVFPDRTPINGIAMNVAQLCNLSCIYCYGVDGEYGEKGFMKPKTAFKTVDWLIENSLDEKEIKIHFFGGEPLLNYPLIKRVVDYSREAVAKVGKTIAFSITTNGTKFSDEINQYLNDNNFNVIISFDGNKDMQDTNRPFKGGRGSFDDARKRVKKFLATRDGNGAAARATITSNNIELQAVRESLADIGFKSMQATFVTIPTSSVFPNEVKKSKSKESSVSACGSGCGTTEKSINLAAKPAETAFPVKFVDNLSAVPPKNGKSKAKKEAPDVKTAKIIAQDDAQIAASQHQSMMDDLEFLAIDTLNRIKKRELIPDYSISALVKQLHKKEKKFYFCGAGRNYFGISISGDVYPCHRFVGQKDKVVGNVADWDPSVQQKYIDNYGMSHEKCSTCFARYYCGGGCFHDSIEVNGRMDEPNDRWCQQMRRRLELAITVYEHLDYWDLVHLGMMKGSIEPKDTKIEEAVSA